LQNLLEAWQLTHLVHIIVIENEIFSMASIKKLIEDVRSVHSFANFCGDLTKLQKEKNPEATPLLSPDVRTQWNSTHAMFKRSCKDCICIEMAFVFVMW